jgi:hypothetical protein
MADYLPIVGVDPKLTVKDDTPMRIGALEFGIM